MAFVFLSADAQDQLFRSRAQGILDAQSSDLTNLGLAVRRPYRGIQIKNDTYATISIIDGRGKPVQLVSESMVTNPVPPDRRGLVDQYADFILQSVTDERVEKQQIVETFGDSFIFFFGERPRIATIVGVLINTEDFNWKSQWEYNYENFLRGSRLVQRNARAFLAYDSIVVEGYPIQFNATMTSESPYMVQFTMNMFVTNTQDFTRVGIVDFPGKGDQLPDIDALNREIDFNASGLIPSGLDVRLAALNAGGGVFSLGGAIREAVSAVNNVTTLIGSTLSDVATLLSGRVVSAPIGIAGFFANASSGIISTDSLGALGTGTAASIVKVPDFAKFAPVNPEIWRTRFSANVDEYPLREQTALNAPPNLRAGDIMALKQRQALRDAAQSKLDTEYVMMNLAAKNQQKLLTNIADIVNYTKQGFALVTTAKAAVKNPGAVIGNALGVGNLLA